MRQSISDLLDTFEYSPLKTDAADIVSPERVKELTMNKIANSTSYMPRENRRLKPLLALIAATVLLAALCGAAYATNIFGLGRIFDSFFNNQAAENRIEVGQSVEHNGIEITLLSAFTDGDIVYALVEIRDIEGKRLSETVRVLNNSFTYSYHILNMGGTEYNDEENRVTLTLTLPLKQPVSIGEMFTLEIDEIVSGIMWVDSEVIDFDIASHVHSGETVYLDQWFELASVGASEKTGVVMGLNKDSELMKLNEMSFDTGWEVISNIGIIDGLLHVQVRSAGANGLYYNHGWFHLLDGNGETLERVKEAGVGEYREMIFDVSAIDDLSNIKLAVSGERFDNIISGPWTISFIVNQELPKMSMTVVPQESTETGPTAVLSGNAEISVSVSPSGSPYLTKLEIECSPMKTIIQMYSINSNIIELEDGTLMQIGFEDFANMSATEYDDIMSEYFRGFRAWFDVYEMPHLTLNDGSIVLLEYGDSGMTYDYYGGWAGYVSEYFNIAELYSITFCGEEYVFDVA